MKKLLTILLAALLCVCCVSMVACKEESGVEGKYKFYSLTYGGTTYNIGDTYQGVVLSADTMSLELKKGGVCVTTSPDGSNNGTWVKDGNTITITTVYEYDGETSTDITNGTLNGEDLTLVYNSDTPYEMTYIFKKA